MLEFIDSSFVEFDLSEVVCVVDVGELQIAELWHGPTGSFKDIALGLVGKLLNYFLAKRGECATVLVSTAGNTGGAVAHCLAGSTCANVIMLYPKDRVDRVQELQMGTVAAENVTVYATRESSVEDNDAVLKRLFDDRQLVERHNLMGLNSVNIGRILMQVVHFFYCYFKVCKEIGNEVVFSVPTGGCGNLAAGIIARLMGIPIKFIVGVNHNDVIHRMIQTGTIQQPREILPSFASAIETGSPSNMERILALLTNSAELIAEQMSDWKSKSKMELTSFQLAALQKIMWSSSVSEREILCVINEVKTRYDYDVCPQTAVAISAARKFTDERRKGVLDFVTQAPIVCLSTATLGKYTAVAAKAGVVAPCFLAVAALQDHPMKSILLQEGEDWEAVIRCQIARLRKC